jgi:hypothetical protein
MNLAKIFQTKRPKSMKTGKVHRKHGKCVSHVDRIFLCFIHVTGVKVGDKTAHSEVYMYVLDIYTHSTTIYIQFSND